MADNVAVTAGAGTNISSDERTIASTTVHVQRINDIGGANFAANDVSVTTTSGSIVAARETRKAVTVLAAPTNTDVVWIGASGVDAATPADGFPLYPGASLTFATTAAIHADTPSGTQTAYYLETFD